MYTHTPALSDKLNCQDSETLIQHAKKSPQEEMPYSRTCWTFVFLLAYLATLVECTGSPTTSKATFRCQGSPNVTTFIGADTTGYVDGVWENARFTEIRDLTTTASGETTFLTNILSFSSGGGGGVGSAVVRKVNISSLVVTTVAGSPSGGYMDAVGANAAFGMTIALALDEDNGLLYVGDEGNRRLRKIHLGSHAVTTVAGNGNATTGTPTDNNPVGLLAYLEPRGLAFDGIHIIYISETIKPSIRTFDIWTNQVGRIAGSGLAGSSSDGVGAAAVFQILLGLEYATGSSILYAAEGYPGKIRQIDTLTNTVTTLAGSELAGYADGFGANALFDNEISDVALSPATGLLYIGSFGPNKRLRVVDVSSGQVTTVAGTGVSGLADGTFTSATFQKPFSVDFSASSLRLLISGKSKIRQICTASPTAAPTPSPMSPTIVTVVPTRSPTTNTPTKPPVTNAPTKPPVADAPTKPPVVSATDAPTKSPTSETVTCSCHHPHHCNQP